MTSLPPSPRAFEALLEPCKRRLWTFLLRLTRDRSLAEDLYQETLLRAWRSFSGYRDKGRFLSWMFRIAHNVVRDDRRRRAAAPALARADDLPEIAGNERAEDGYETCDAQRRLARELPRLTESQREVLLLRMHSDLTFRAIAELQGAPLSTVINRMHDALRKLHETLEKE